MGRCDKKKKRSRRKKKFKIVGLYLSILVLPLIFNHEPTLQFFFKLENSSSSREKTLQ